MAEKIKGYRKRIEKRKLIAKRFGRNGFYTSAAGFTYPKPLSVLLQMMESGGE